MGNLIDLTGRRFGNWTVIERDYEASKKNIYWKCQCDCGTLRSVAGTSLRSGISTSCGCERDQKTSVRSKANVEDLTGQRFGSWLVIRRDFSENNSSKRGARWICRCDCGNEKSVLGYALRLGRSRSCGCQTGSVHIIDLVGQRFGKLVVLRRSDEKINGHRGTLWVCKCDCGNEVTVLSGRLRSGQTRSCGCLLHEKKVSKNTDLTGKVFGKWTVSHRDEAKKGKRTFYVCQCECGTVRSVTADSLTRGLSKSCGCEKSIPKNDITGQRFGKLTVVGIDYEKRGKGLYWKCKCDCGGSKSFRANHLFSGNVKSCGCETRKASSERRFMNLSNTRYGKLVVVEVDHKEIDISGNSSYFWKCKCDCGNTVVVQGSVLRRGDTKSCGCLQSEESAQRAKDRTIDLVGKRFGLLTVVERVSVSDDSNSSTWKCVCECGNEKFADGYYLIKGMITSCGCLKQSKLELFVIQYFDEIGYTESVDYEYQKRFDALRGDGGKPLSYDFSVYKNTQLYALIECQGQQHYKPVGLFGGDVQFKKQKRYDNQKRVYAQFLGVPLIEIPFTAETYEEVKQILVASGI